ncbi:MAG: hypothetical protein NXI04_02695 [Planctomycetaceae bacterium]|nr:hypothetical protein [Planctomycetaceae bacterium]
MLTSATPAPTPAPTPADHLSRKRHLLAPLITAALIACSSAAVAQSPRRIGLQGYCPVTLIDSDYLQKGHPGLTQKYDGVEYRFTSRAARRAFNANPQRYLPVFGGDCVVCYDEAQIRVAGRLEFASLHKGRLYLFPSRQWKQKFDAAPVKYEDVDLAVGGHSIVWLAERGLRVSGTADRTEIHNGFRYQFASEQGRRSFLTRKRLYETVARRHGPLLVAQRAPIMADPANTAVPPPRPSLN